MSDELHVALEAARQAGQILRAQFGAEHDITYKGPIDIVTEVDHAVQARIVEILQTATPHYAFLTEEGTRNAEFADPRWIIDPLDGTVNYSRGSPRFCVSIALEREGDLKVGVIYDPLRDELFAAEHNAGASLNGSVISVSRTASLAQALVTTGFPYNVWTGDHDNLTEIGLLVKRVMALRITGSAALDLAAVACGRCDAFWEPCLEPYDVAAGTLIVREAGGVVTNFSGNSESVYSGQVLAANSVLHQAILPFLCTQK